MTIPTLQSESKSQTSTWDSAYAQWLEQNVKAPTQEEVNDMASVFQNTSIQRKTQKAQEPFLCFARNQQVGV